MQASGGCQIMNDVQGNVALRSMSNQWPEHKAATAAHAGDVPDL